MPPAAVPSDAVPPAALPSDAARDLRRRQISWAARYDAYRRLAGDPVHLQEMLEPVTRAYADAGRVPAWAGVDLLRAWAFFLFRADYHSGGYALEIGGSAEATWRHVLAAVAAHPDARPADRPPVQERPPVPDRAAADAPRRLRDAGFRAAQHARTGEPHVAALTAVADRAAAERPGSVVPRADPDSGGVAARVLLLHDVPPTSALRAGLLSVDADDRAAARAWHASAAGPLARTAVLHWTAVPWRPRDRWRGPVVDDVLAGARRLGEALTLLEHLRVVVPLGPVAATVVASLPGDLAARGVRVLVPGERQQPVDGTRTGFAAVDDATLRRARDLAF